MSKRRINEAIRRAEKITPDVQEAIKDMPAAAVGVELDALADLDPKDQPLALDRVRSGASKNFREAKVFIQGDDKARPKAARKKMRKFQADYEARLRVAIPSFEEREEAAAKSNMADVLDTMAAYFEKERAELRRLDYVPGDSPDQKQEQSQLDSLKTAWRSASDGAKESFVEWAADAQRLGMRNRDDDEAGP